jgi:hypothetical protein
MTRLRRGYGEAGGSRWIGFSRRRSQIIRQRRKNQAAKAAYAANALRTTRSTPRRPQEFIESFTRTTIAPWLRGSLLRCVILSRNKQRFYVRSWIAAATQRGSENICDKFVSPLPEPTSLADRLRLSPHRRSHSRHRRLVSPPPHWRRAGHRAALRSSSFRWAIIEDKA